MGKIEETEKEQETFGDRIVQVRNVDKNFEVTDTYVKVIKDMSFHVLEGEFVMICGPSGSGKSTLLHMINGWEEPTYGDILIEGRNIYMKTENELAEMRYSTITMVHQMPYWIHSLNVLENIGVPFLLSGHSKKESVKRAKNLISLLGLEEFSNYKPANLSGGQQQRISLLRALINNPKIIIADEPTGNLDSKASAEIMDFFLKINRQLKRTIIIATHDMEFLKYATTVVQIDDGRVEKVTAIREGFIPQQATGDVVDMEKFSNPNESLMGSIQEKM